MYHSAPMSKLMRFFVNAKALANNNDDNNEAPRGVA